MIVDDDVRAIRESAAVARLPDVWAVMVRGADAHDALDRIVPCDLFIRDSQVRHTLLLDDDACPFADVYVGNDDGDYFLLGEGPPAAHVMEHLRRHIPTGAAVELEDLSSTHAVVSLNGPFAWEVMAALEGTGIIGFSYLSFFHPQPDRTYLRAGKTGELGYDLLVPRKDADVLVARLLDLGAPFGCRAIDPAALRVCALENWFFDVRRQSRSGLTPVELQLQWRVSFKKSFIGAEALRTRRTTATRRVVAIRSASEISMDDEVAFAQSTIGIVLDAQPSPTLGGFVGMALLDLPYAHAGIDRYRVRERPIRTVSPPTVNNRSLFVNPQRHTYASRDEIRFPPAARTPWIACT